MHNNSKRNFIKKTGLGVVWVPPVILIKSLPTHAQTTVTEPPVEPPVEPMVSYELCANYRTFGGAGDNNTPPSSTLARLGVDQVQVSSPDNVPLENIPVSMTFTNSNGNTLLIGFTTTTEGMSTSAMSDASGMVTFNIPEMWGANIPIGNPPVIITIEFVDKAMYGNASVIIELTDQMGLNTITGC